MPPVGSRRLDGRCAVIFTKLPYHNLPSTSTLFPRVRTTTSPWGDH